MPVGLRGGGLVSSAIDKARRTQSLYSESGDSVASVASKPRFVSLGQIDVESGSIDCCDADGACDMSAPITVRTQSDTSSEASFGAGYEGFEFGFETDDMSDMSSVSSVSSISSFGCAVEEGYFNHYMGREDSDWDDDASSVSSISTIGPHSFSNPAFMSLVAEHELDVNHADFHNQFEDIAAKKKAKKKKKKKKVNCDFTCGGERFTLFL